MPILNVEIIGSLSRNARKNLAAKLADAAGKVLETTPGQTWVQLCWVSRTDYAENSGTPKGIKPVFVWVLKKSPPIGRKLKVEVTALTHAIALVCGRPAENVHVIYELRGAGRVSFGGRLVKN